MIILFLISLCSALVSSEPFKFPEKETVASEGQIKFAIENNYDNTGPGSKERPAAYKTYKTLEEALVGYLDDPDTKLPRQDKQKLFKTFKPLSFNDIALNLGQNKVKFNQFKDVLQKPSQPTYLNSVRNNYPYKDADLLDSVGKFGVVDIKNSQNNLLKQIEGFNKLTNLESGVRGRHKIGVLPPIEQLNNFGDFGAGPHYSYSYGVHDHLTGDTKSAHESRDGGGAVRGYYSVLDADGQHRTVHYTADDNLGFRATVHRTPTFQ